MSVLKMKIPLIHDQVQPSLCVLPRVTFGKDDVILVRNEHNHEISKVEARAMRLD